MNEEGRRVPRTKKRSKKNKKWALVLTGGGARGLAHIGVLEVLDERGLKPDVIVGTSMGAVVGGFYAAGVSPRDMRGLAEELSLEKIVSPRARRFLLKKRSALIDYVLLEVQRLRLAKKASARGKDKIECYLRSIVGGVRIEDLPIPFACNALDLVSGREHVFCRGPLARAIRASMSYPLALEPVRMKRMVLVDGGLIDNTPVRIARELGAGRVVLSDVRRGLKPMPAARLRNPFLVAQRVVQTVTTKATEEQKVDADFILRVPVDVETLDFRRVPAIIRKGRAAALAAVTNLS
jgi:NTE family protein